jgi:lysosomal acid lipase/cholesteryl ester hydrolase
MVVTDDLVCKNIIFVFAGPSKHYNVSRTSVYTTHTPAGTSVKNLAHFAQMVISGKHQMYDYGSAEANYKHYHQRSAPVYNVSEVNVPVALYWANNDWLADPLDVQYLRKNLPNLVEDFCVEDWDHLDFTWSINGREAMYDRMISLMNSYL